LFVKCVQSPLYAETLSEIRNRAVVLKRLSLGYESEILYIELTRTGGNCGASQLETARRRASTPVKLKFHWDQFPRNFLSDLLASGDVANFLVTSWQLPRNICYGEVTG